MGDALGILWVLGAAALVMAPALSHGIYLGPFDVLSRLGLSERPGVTVVHNFGSEDQILALIPWSSLVWTQVHHAQLPLWNPYSVLGTPLAFNWQSAPLSLPSLVGYLVPLRLAYTVQILVTLVIGGTGVYVLGRVMRLGVLGSATAATVFELSGSFMGWLGWPNAAVMAWAGWIFAAAILVIRGNHRARSIAFLAVAVAFAIYAGNPETGIVMALGFFVFLLVFLGLRAPALSGSGPIFRPVVDLVLSLTAGLALAAPLLLPGIQVNSISARGAVKVNYPLTFHDLAYVVFQGFDGVPVGKGIWFGNWAANYVQTAAYVGVIALVLAVTAVAIRWRDHAVLAFGAVAIVTGLVAFASPIESIMDSLPTLGKVQWHYTLFPMDFALAILAGVGMDLLVRRNADRRVKAWAGGGFVVAAFVLSLVWAFGRGHLPSNEASVRAHSFIWPVFNTTLGIVVVTFLAVWHKQNRRIPRSGIRLRRASLLAGVVLLAGETGFLIAAGSPLLSSSSSVLRPTPAEVHLKRAVGSSVVGLGLPSQDVPSLGMAPNTNILLGLHEFAVYDPDVPNTYFTSWKAATNESGGFQYIFGPVVGSAQTARLFGISYVLEPIGSPGPTGAVFDTRVGANEVLYRIPDAALATEVPLKPGGVLPDPDALGKKVAVENSNPASWTVKTDSTEAAVLRLRLTNVPGWHATIDGRPLNLEPFAGAMLQARIPSGHHTVQLNYWPTSFSYGLVIGAFAVVMLSAAVALELIRKRRVRAYLARDSSYRNDP